MSTVWISSAQRPTNGTCSTRLTKETQVCFMSTAITRRKPYGNITWNTPSRKLDPFFLLSLLQSMLFFLWWTIRWIIRIPGVDDQTAFWNLLRLEKKMHVSTIGQCKKQQLERKQEELSSSSSIAMNDTIVTCHLDGCLFSAGALSPHKNYGSGFGMLFEGIYNRRIVTPNVSLVTLHANYITSNHNKMEALKGVNMWLTTAASTSGENFGGTCRNFTPTF